MILPLRLLADDLTGALDSAAPFASPAAPVMVPWKAPRPEASPAVAVTSESRNLPGDLVVEQVCHGMDQLGPAPQGTLWFKKVDSVLRGHAVAETAAMMRYGGFSLCVFAPAFPRMGRVTRGGRQYVVEDAQARAVGPEDLRAAFLTEGIAVAERPSTAQEAPTVIVADAETDADLARIVADHVGTRSLLWAGSGGLASALAGPEHAADPPPVGAIIVGTTHPATRAQVECLGNCAEDAPRTGSIHADPCRPTLIDPVPMARHAVETRNMLIDALLRIEPVTSATGLVVVGGDTLSTVLDAVAATGLACLGQVSAGLPLSRIEGGRLDGTPIITKSGGFGRRDCLLRLLGQSL